MESTFRIRRAEDSEVELYIEWGNKAGWNMNPQITRNFHKEFPAGWFLCELTTGNLDSEKVVESNLGEGSKVVGLLYCTKYRTSIGFIGFFMVDLNCRGQGYGHKLFQFVLDRFLLSEESGPPAKAVGLFSAPTAEEYYKRFGFETKGKAARFKGKVNPILLNRSSNSGDERNEVDERLNHMTESDLEEVALLDEQYSLTYRRDFWRNWVESGRADCPKRFSVIYRGDSGKIEGMGMLRRLPQGFRLGPLYASDFEVIEAMVKRLLEAITRHDTVVIDVHCGNKEACEWYKTLGLQEVLQTSYMWKGDFTLEEEKVKRIYAMASLDFN